MQEKQLSLSDGLKKADIKSKSIGVSVRGVSHYNKGIPCQDACSFQQINSEFVVFCVADGAGSASESHISAQLISQLFVRECKNHLDIEIQIPITEGEWRRVVQQIYWRLQSAILMLVHHQKAYLGVKDFRTTLSFAIVHANYVVAGQVGDGTIVIQTTKGELLCLCIPCKGEFANETYFLDNENLIQNSQFRFFDGEIKSIALLTDGLVNLALKRVEGKYVPYEGFFNPLFEILEDSNKLGQTEAELYSYLHSSTVCCKTNDDKTLVIGVFEQSIETVDAVVDKPESAETEKAVQSQADVATQIVTHEDLKSQQKHPTIELPEKQNLLTTTKSRSPFAQLLSCFFNFSGK